MIAVTTEKLLTAGEAARLLKKTPRTIRNWIAWGWLRGKRLGGQWYTSVEAIDEMGEPAAPPVMPATKTQREEANAAVLAELQRRGLA